MWTKVDDHLHSHPKVMELWRHKPRHPLALHLIALSYAGFTNQDGRVSQAFVEEKLPSHSERRRLIAALVGIGLWDELEDGSWRIHDYLDANMSREQIAARTAVDKRRKALQRRPGLLDLVRARDRDHCRYCGERVSFARGRNGDGATYDLVAPEGSISKDNVVLCCRRCAGRKGLLTVEQAGLCLLPEPATQLPLGGDVRTDGARMSADVPAADGRRMSKAVGSADGGTPRPDPTRPEV